MKRTMSGDGRCAFRDVFSSEEASPALSAMLMPFFLLMIAEFVPTLAEPPPDECMPPPPNTNSSGVHVAAAIAVTTTRPTPECQAMHEHEIRSAAA